MVSHAEICCAESSNSKHEYYATTIDWSLKLFIQLMKKNSSTLNIPYDLFYSRNMTGLLDITQCNSISCP